MPGTRGIAENHRRPLAFSSCHVRSPARIVRTRLKMLTKRELISQMVDYLLSRTGLFRQFSRGNGVIERHISDLSRPGALTASLNRYRANLAPRMPGLTREPPWVQAPRLGIWSTNDHYLYCERMKMSDRFVKGPWRYEQIDGASHWIPLDVAERLNQLLTDWLD